MRLANKIAVITGAGSGMGKAMAELFAAEGAKVVCADISGQQNDVAAAIGAAAIAVHADVADEASVRGMVGAAEQRFGRLDILVNNAGIGFPPRPLGEEEMEHHYKVWAVNADGVYLGIRAVAPFMSSQRAGSIVNISSIDGLDGVAGMMSYTASKFAVTGMTRTAALELGTKGIRVNSIHPGVIATPMLDAAPPETLERLQRVLDRQPIPRMGTAEEVAFLALYLASDESSYCTGAQFVIDGGHLAGPYREGYGP
jgi:3alpha(or 20beta)-hydroxysteroid dehydrogenase